MNSNQIMWTMITNLLSTVYTYYDASNVFSAFQNDFTPPKINDYIMIRLLDNKQDMTPLNKFDAETQINTLTGFYSGSWQIDLYGKNADISSTLLLTYLNSSSASNFLLTYNFGIGKVQSVKNLTKYNDRDKFMPRYVINFETLRTNNVALPTPGIALEDVIITLEEQN